MALQVETQTVNALRAIVIRINLLEDQLSRLTDEDLQAKTKALRDRVRAGEEIDQILARAFALVREASRRTIGLRHTDVQLMGGVLVSRGSIAEIRSGEGKTLVATLPLFLSALAGGGVHLVTANDYLARRDGGWMGKVFHLLGMSVSCIGPQQYSMLFDPEYINFDSQQDDERLVHWRPCTRQQAYQADITYGTSTEFCFDYLRDNVAARKEQLVQRGLNHAVIDDVDNVLIDEAQAPLTINGPAGPAGLSKSSYPRFAEYVRRLKINTAEEGEEPNGHYDIDQIKRTISLTDIGISEIERRIPEIDHEANDSLYEPRHRKLIYYLERALRAQYLFERDVHYLVQDGEVIVIDEFTGRPVPGRRHSDGLHEAIEAKEGVRAKRKVVTVATITLQNYFRLYNNLGGMADTAQIDADEFNEIYKLGVTPLPTNIDYIVNYGQGQLETRKEEVDGAEVTTYVDPQSGVVVYFKRTDFAHQLYSTLKAKNQAIIAEIKRVHSLGRPILVGTTSAEHSEVIQGLLERENLPHTVLNAKIHQSEALIVAQAGRKGAVTICTHMAGRGTDILLGGTPEGLAAESLENEMFDRPMLTQLAFKLLTEGEAAARDVARKSNRLTEDLVDALLETRARFAAAMTEIEQVQVIGYLARVLQEPYGIDYNDLLNTLRLVRAGEVGKARTFVEGLDKGVALVDEILRRQSELIRWQNIHTDDKLAAQFLADQVFERHYNFRAALIHAVMSNRHDEARRLVETIPGLAPQHIEHIKELCVQAAVAREEIWNLGGLHVIGSELQESRRRDNQLRGRAARQGAPGSSRFFLSLEDDLMRRFGGEQLKSFMLHFNAPEGLPIESGVLNRLIESFQERLEGYRFDQRKNMVEYDDVMNQQRQAIYNERWALLMGESLDLDHRIDNAFQVAIGDLVDHYVSDYPGYIRSEVERVVGDFTIGATDTVVVPAVIRQLGPLLPLMAELDLTDLQNSSPDQLTQKLVPLAHEQESQRTNLSQLLQAMGRFLPLVPPVPNLGALATHKGGQMLTRERLRGEYIAQVQTLYNEFLAETLAAAERYTIWAEAEAELTRAFSGFNLDGLSIKNMEERQRHFRTHVDEVLRDLLLHSLQKLDGEQLASALEQYIDRQQDKWRKYIGDEEYQNYQRLLLLSAIDREWRAYLAAMDDLRSEVSLQAFGQRDSKSEHKKRSSEMFADMRHNIDHDITDRFFREIASHKATVQQLAQAVAKTQV